MGRATLIDTDKTEDLLDEETEVVGELETQDTTQDLETTQVDVQPDQEDDIPDKYRDKSVKEIIEMHQNAEKYIGKQSSEVGELRKTVDEFIQGQLAAQQQAPSSVSTEDDDELDFFVDPSTAVNKKIDSHPAIREAREYAELQKKAAATAQLNQKHPDVEAITKDEKFIEWVKSSKIRTELFARADQQFDIDAADSLLSDWKERQQIASQAATVDKQARKQTMKSAATGNARGTSEPTRKKVYRRADIIKLMKTDPQRYTALQPEIMQAYQEGRVK